MSKPPGPNAKKAKILEFEARVQERLKKVLAESGHTTGRGLPAAARVKTVSWSLRRVSYEFLGETFTFNAPALFILALVVGLIGGTYGIGGGAIIAPFLAAIFQLPIYTIAGAALLGTFLTSVAGVALFVPFYPNIGGGPGLGPGSAVRPRRLLRHVHRGPPPEILLRHRSSASAWGWSSPAWPCATSWGSL